jgi:hypothetical protein
MVFISAPCLLNRVGSKNLFDMPLVAVDACVLQVKRQAFDSGIGGIAAWVSDPVEPKHHYDIYAGHMYTYGNENEKTPAGT